jgi:hypothetical protein
VIETEISRIIRWEDEYALDALGEGKGTDSQETLVGAGQGSQRVYMRGHCLNRSAMKKMRPPGDLGHTDKIFNGTGELVLPK